MTVLLGGSGTFGGYEKHERSKKVTGSQDDGFVGGEKHPVSYAENTKRSKKSQALRMTISWEF
jgi:hypothetical protein